MNTTFASIDEIKQWSSSGRVGIRTDDDAHSGNFNWRHNDKEFEFIISGPFGQGTTKISGTEGHKEHEDLAGHEDHKYHNIVLEYKDIVASGTDAEALLLDHFGWHFPIIQISYWVRGIPYSGSKAMVIYDDELESTLKPTTIIQDDWTINYTRYETVNGVQLPHKLQAEKLPYRVNLIINSWDIQ